VQQAVLYTLAHWKDRISTDRLVVTPEGLISAASLHYRDGKIEIAIEQLTGDLQEKTVSANRVTISMLAPPTNTPWDSLAPPVDFELERVKIGHLLVLKDGKTVTELRNISGAIGHRSKKFEFRNTHVDIPACGIDCALNASGSVASRPPYLTAAKIVFHYKLIGDPLTLRGDAKGDLFRLVIVGDQQGDVQWRALRASHSATLTLLEPKPIWLVLDYKIEDLNQANLAASGVQLPLNGLRLNLSSRLNFGAQIGGPIELNNKNRAAIDQGSLPFATSKATLLIATDRITLSDWQIDQHGKGDLRYQFASQALSARLPIARFDPQEWHSSTKTLPKRWNGIVSVSIPSMQYPQQNRQIQFSGESQDLAQQLGPHSLLVKARIEAKDWALEQAQLSTTGPHALLRSASATANARGASVSFAGLRLGQLPDAWQANLDPRTAQWIADYVPSQLQTDLAQLDGVVQIAGDIRNGTVNQLTVNAQGAHDTAIQVRAQSVGPNWALQGTLNGPGKSIAMQTTLSSAGNILTRSEINVRATQWNSVKISANAVDLQARAEPQGPDLALSLKLKAGGVKLGNSLWEQIEFQANARQTSAGLSGIVEQLSAKETALLAQAWEVRLQTPARFSVQSQQLSLDAANLRTSLGDLVIESLRTGSDGLQATLTSIVSDTTRLTAFVSVPASLRATLGSAAFTGRANLMIPMHQTGRLDISKAKASGRLQTTQIVSRSALVQSAALNFTLENLLARLQLELSDTQKGTLVANATLPLNGQENALALARDQTIEIDANGQMNASVLAPLIDSEIRLGGQLQLNLRVRGSLDKPLTSGTVFATGLSLQHPPSNLSLRDGVLRARLDGTALYLEEWRMLQGNGAGQSGELKVTGRYTWGGSNDDAFALEVKRMLLPISPDQRLIVSGQGNLKVRPGAVHLDAKVQADQARLILRQEKTQDLGDDVRIVGRKATASIATIPVGEKRLAFTSDIDVDLGPDFRFSGEGIKGRLDGKVRLLANGANSLRSLGTVNIVEGTYARYGQSLKIESGVLRFAGPLDNPSLDIEAVRPNLPVPVSVRVAGTAQSPKIRLESVQAMSEAEKLSWLALGAPLGDTLGSEQSGTLASALAGMLADASGAESSITQSLGLTQLGMAKNDKGTNIVSVGKRLGDRLLVTYEQGLRGVWNILRVQFQLTKQLEIRVQAGTESSIDLLWVLPLQR
jgi:TamB, inner membrane protein subunit of TAM complex